MTEESKGFLKRIPLAVPVFVIIAVLYAAWIFYSRWSEERHARQTATTREVEQARRDVELNGGSRLKITALSASTGVVHSGQSVQICYGVVNAKNVSFDPPVDNVWPSQSRCVDVSPRKSTTYTLNADDGAGHKDSAQVSIRVR